MLPKRVIPLLMLHRQQLYKSVGFGRFNYIGDPLVAVKIFNEMAAQEICLVDTDPCRNGGTPDFALLKDIAGECFMPLSYGGGIRSVADARKVLYSGFEKIVVNSALHQNPTLLNELVAELGSSSVVVSVDYKTRNGRATVHTEGGKNDTGKPLADYIRHAEDGGAGEILLTSIDHEGKMAGIDTAPLALLKNGLGIPLVVSGGIGSQAHIKEAFDHGADAVAAASLFVYKGAFNAVLINYPEKTQLKKLFAQP